MSCSLNQWRRTFTQVLWISLAIFMCFSAAMSQAQSNAADLQGVVRDQNGAVVANASVTARNAGTNVSREATTNDDGFYKIVNLPPGNYIFKLKTAQKRRIILLKQKPESYPLFFNGILI